MEQHVPKHRNMSKLGRRDLFRKQGVNKVLLTDQDVGEEAGPTTKDLLCHTNEFTLYLLSEAVLLQPFCMEVPSCFRVWKIIVVGEWRRFSEQGNTTGAGSEEPRLRPLGWL